MNKSEKVKDTDTSSLLPCAVRYITECAHVCLALYEHDLHLYCLGIVYTYTNTLMTSIITSAHRTERSFRRYYLVCNQLKLVRNVQTAKIYRQELPHTTI
jgi:hypothetical protein